MNSIRASTIFNIARSGLILDFNFQNVFFLCSGNRITVAQIYLHNHLPLRWTRMLNGQLTLQVL